MTAARAVATGLYLDTSFEKDFDVIIEIVKMIMLQLKDRLINYATVSPGLLNRSSLIMGTLYKRKGFPSFQHVMSNVQHSSCPTPARMTGRPRACFPCGL